MDLTSIIITKENAIAFVTINEPKTRNALSNDILSQLQLAFDAFSKDRTVRVIILTGTERSFVAGANIQEMANMSYEEAKLFSKFGSSVFRQIETCPQPVIAAVNGYALGGGCELALACDIRIASENAKFGQPETSLGVTPGFSGTQRLSRVVGVAKAKELIYTGKAITAEEAYQIGLVNQLATHETLMSEAIKMAETIALQAPIAVQNAKKAINEGIDKEMHEGINIETEYFARCFQTQDQKNGMKAFLNKEKASFLGE